MAPIDRTDARGVLPSDADGPPLDRIVGPIARRERYLWALAAFALLADVITTLVGLRAGLVEGNPVVAGALASAGLAGFLAIKIAAFAVAIGVRLAAPRFRVAVPLGVATPWLLAAVTNVYLLGSAT